MCRDRASSGFDKFADVHSIKSSSLTRRGAVPGTALDRSRFCASSYFSPSRELDTARRVTRRGLSCDPSCISLFRTATSNLVSYFGFRNVISF